MSSCLQTPQQRRRRIDTGYANLEIVGDFVARISKAVLTALIGPRSRAPHEFAPLVAVRTGARRSLYRLATFIAEAHRARRQQPDLAAVRREPRR